jgi:hypothetical protein
VIRGIAALNEVRSKWWCIGDCANVTVELTNGAVSNTEAEQWHLTCSVNLETQHFYSVTNNVHIHHKINRLFFKIKCF